MKELSIEQKAKAYDEAKKVIKDNLDALNEITETGAEVVNIQSIKNCFCRAFPELTESEDEKVRKELIKALSSIGKRNWGGIDVFESIAWLEKQGDLTIRFFTNEFEWALGRIITFWNQNHKDGKYDENELMSYIKVRETELVKLFTDNVCKVSLSDCSEEYRKAYYDGYNKCNRDWLKIKDISVDEYNKNAEILLGEQGEQNTKQVSIWKHWKYGIAGNGDGEPIYLIKNGYTYSLSSCLSYECDYIELSELDKLMIEKQGEQKSIDKVEPFDKYEGLTDFERTLADICIGWIGEEPGWKQYIKDNADVLLKIAIEKFNSVQDTLFEQKPAWSEEDIRNIQDIDSILFYDKDLPEETCMRLRNWLKSLKPHTDMVEALRTEYEKGRADTLSEMKSSWSEEDEVRLQACLDTLQAKSLMGKIDTVMTEWLKSLKDRVILQPKHEWSIEDERVIAIINNALTESNTPPDDYDKVYDWLESIKQRIGWKPSNEQIEALEHFVRSIGESGYASPYDNNTKLLYSLLEQLKKLKA